VHAAGNAKTATTDLVVPVSTGPGTGTGTGTDPVVTQTADPQTGTSLLGVEGGVIGAGGALVAGTALAGQLVTLGGSPSVAVTTSLAGSMPAGGVLGQPGTGRGDGGATNGQRTTPGNMRESTGRAASARGGGDRGPGGRTTRMGVPGRDGVFGQRGAGPAARGTGDGDDEEQYDTWLTEDDMVWGDDENAPPPVLGGTAPPPPPPAPAA
jgi:hypothetical protein